MSYHRREDFFKGQTGVKRIPLPLTGGFEKAASQPERKVTFLGEAAIKHPVIGSIYQCHIDEFGHKRSTSADRPMILVGYYMQNGIPVACDFIKPTTVHADLTSAAANPRHDLYIERKNLPGYKTANIRIKCGQIITLPNTDEFIRHVFPIGKTPSLLLADYLLRRNLSIYESKPEWINFCNIPKNSVRHGFILDQLDPSICPENCPAPDIPGHSNNFEYHATGPRFIVENISRIMDWARKAHLIRQASDTIIDLPPIKSFPEWVKPESLVRSRDAQWKCIKAFGC